MDAISELILFFSLKNLL